MCKLCEIKPVYEFTNKRKLCKNCFIRYFQKKVFYTIRKFKMAQRGEIIGYVSGTHKVGLKEGCTPRRREYLFEALNQVYPKGHKGLKENIENNIFTKGKNNKGFREVVLEDVLKMFVEKAYCVLAPQTYSEPSRSERESSEKILTKGKKVDKIAVSSTIDQEANEFVNEIIKGNLKKLNKIKPVEDKFIKPLYLFLDKEVLLYAKLKGLKYKKEKIGKNKINDFLNELEEKHPEVKRAIVNSYLKLCV